MRYTSDNLSLANLPGLFGRSWYLPEWPNLFGGQEEVIGADPKWDTWAVKYACDDWIFGLFNSRQATLLSRTKHVTAATLRKAQLVLKGVKYDTLSLWTGPDAASSHCSFSAEKAYPIQALEMFSSEPAW
eukprot:CAMPEP_0170497076 /NCGR_PEP_ID=MMETSP0208-20121228/23640_1 /TAXON_ID=197538 /ORGANISM="Strombidium inclinatum, Strain S3" /LENGTH=129 /DNA_ID=CAMNT_0010773775 /DNA_START=252 /DNA_END=638 /DNA_ORIENTATION=-